MANKMSIDELAAVLTAPYTHLELGQVNDHAAYVMHFKDEYPFHRHTKDELYLVLEGEVTIRFRNLPEVTLSKNESMVVRAYTTHSPSSPDGALVLMIKPKEMFGSHSEQE
ncbi:MAG: cupin domain-containing protein [Thermoanaerobaculaceae bacterium]|nr:cupin domain-containing protein [Thermoanaerobaculaceae bacterium]MDI9623100.1 cupin domain-containing protein [Acidobacteriota bacterium]NLH11391.1 cupin domain-containing protein [Holophagae bacterium]HPW55415.1 cupin domain-containing protein [Thermoanaerobaculaceae bacterium]